ncbi:MAG: type I-C CRISPR-associated endonuclease Cas1 [Kiritimatiellae bacterium]|nr:type I-C CRISPR-associated endonuclease Cas1 [Kiritimatiellia bacterium]
MKKLLNTLYVQTQGTYLRREGETVVAEREREVVARIPIHTLSGIVCFGNVLCSPFLLGLCGERGVHVGFLTEHGRFLARVEGPVSGNVLLRVAQMEAAHDAGRGRDLASAFVAGKILNARTVLQRRLRDHGDEAGCARAVDLLAGFARQLRQAETTDAVRGAEGEAAACYFAVFNELIVAQRAAFAIRGRNRRPPLDPMNALLSFLYTLLAHDCTGALESVGLDPQIGFLHALRPGRDSLALDLMEEFRAPLADRLALSLVNLQRVSRKDFRTSESGAVEMSENARKTVLLAWQQKKKETIVHPFLGEKVEIGLLPHVQAQLLARHLRGDLDGYPPFLLK